MQLYSWLIQKDKRAFCKYCEQTLPNHLNLIKRHDLSSAHIGKINLLKNQLKIDQEFEKNGAIKQKEAELKILLFIVKYNLPFTIIEPLVDLVKSVDPTSKVCKNIQLGRTKGTDIINTLLCAEGTRAIFNVLQKQHFSLIIDETNDVSCKKCLTLVARYFDSDENITKDTFLAMLELENCDSKSIFDCIVNFFKTHNIPFNNCIGFAADNASVMMGKNKGVQALFKEMNPYIYTLGCSCHSLHLCSSSASKELPESCEKLAKDIYYHFSHSSQRQCEFQKFQKDFNVPAHKILKLSGTRWLSYEGVCQRLVEHWLPLKHYFLLNEFENKKAESNNSISQNLTEANFIYLLFIVFILKMTNNLNKEFQSEQPKIYKLLPAVKTFILTVLTNFVKRECIDTNNLGSIDFNDNEIYIE